MKRFTPIQTRREFLNQVGRGMVTAAIGYNVARELSLAPLLATEVEGRLHFGALEPLVNLMQETSSAKLLPLLVEKLRTGTQLKELVAAAAFANARTFGGEDYVGYHTMMALAPGFHMAQELPASERPLPVLKVLYRNTRRIEEKGPAQGDVLRPIEAAAQPAGSESGAWFRDAVHTKDATRAEAALAAIAGRDIDEAFNALLYAVHDDTEVHRTVLPYRAWDLAGLIGREQALTLLRQSVRYCVSAESWSGRAGRDEPRALLPKLLEEYKLLSKTPGTRLLDDGAVEEMSMLLFRSTPQEAAAAAAAALADGIAPDAIGEAISLAANQLVLRDHGRKPPEESPGKPIGSVHGDSIGVHASDSANAWRSMARQTAPRNTFACLLLGAYQVSRDRIARGGDFLKWEPLPLQRHVDSIKAKSTEDLLRELDESIRANLQARASAVVARYAQEGGSAQPVFDLLRRYAISEDGALHAEKYFRTVTEEFQSTRPTKRWRHLIGLARVTASECGRPAAGVAEARALLGV